MEGYITEISSKDAKDFLLPRHYSGRTPTISKAFGWYSGGILQAVITFGKPATPTLCNGICGKEWSKNVYELNRLCREEEFEQPLSHLVSFALKQLKPLNWIIVSYSDTAMHHNGYIYQACNFLYTGQTKPRTDMYCGESRHSRHYTQEDLDKDIRIVRSAKNRYVYFNASNKREKRKMQQALKYKILPYPKDENKNYVLGEYIKPTLINKKTKEIVQGG